MNSFSSFSNKALHSRWLFLSFTLISFNRCARKRTFRHGIRQLRSQWADGPSYVTQCPIQTGRSYVYNFTIVGQRGTLWWHAHASWLRVTLYGPLIILPKLGVSYPFPQPYKEVPIMLGNDKLILLLFEILLCFIKDFVTCMCSFVGPK